MSVTRILCFGGCGAPIAFCNCSKAAPLHDDRSAAFRTQYLQEFKPDKGRQALCNRLQEYYHATPSSMGNREAMAHWKFFKQWAAERGFTPEDIDQAKRHLRA